MARVEFDESGQCALCFSLMPPGPPLLLYCALGKGEERVCRLVVKWTDSNEVDAILTLCAAELIGINQLGIEHLCELGNRIARLPPEMLLSVLTL